MEAVWLDILSLAALVVTPDNPGKHIKVQYIVRQKTFNEMNKRCGIVYKLLGKYHLLIVANLLRL